MTSSSTSQSQHLAPAAPTTALVATAGFGTRFLPISKTVQKEMLPILNRPMIDYVVQDLVRGGVTKIIFVINEHNIQIKHYFSRNDRLKNYLDSHNKSDKYQEVAHLHSQAEFVFIKQPDSMLYGTAAPVVLGKEYLQRESSFFVIMGDDMLYGGPDHCETARMIQHFQATNAPLVTCIERPNDQLHLYGIAETQEKNGETYLKRLVEKPAPGTAPSNLSNVSKYILTPDIFPILEQQPPNPASGELYLTDTVEQLAAQRDVVIHTPQAEYLDGGSVSGWLRANLRVAQDHPELWAEVQEFMAHAS